MYRTSYYSTSNSLSPTTTRYTVRFSGQAIETTVTNDSSSVDSWVRGIRSTRQAGRLIVGLDCEWRPNYVRGQENKVATLQLCVDNKCLIIQLFHMGRNRIPHSIRSFLADDNNVFVGVGVELDVEKLYADYGLWCRASKDLEMPCNLHLNRSSFQPRLGLKGYAREVLGLFMDKPRNVTMSNWQNRNLSEAQVQYACIDAYVSYKLGIEVLEI